MGTIPDAPTPPTGRTFARMNRPPALLLAAALTSLAALAGCSLGGGERVGGEPAPDAHELTMLTIFDEARQFADEVSRLSNG